MVVYVYKLYVTSSSSIGKGKKKHLLEISQTTNFGRFDA
jgi:hypothetical protein